MLEKFGQGKHQTGGSCVMWGFMCCTSDQMLWQVIKSRRIRWVRHVASMQERRNVYRILVRKSEERTVLGRPGVEWGIILNGSYRNRVGELGLFRFYKI
jgi:hypothetical protein